jgi:hypothetical protein
VCAMNLKTLLGLVLIGSSAAMAAPASAAPTL